MATTPVAPEVFRAMRPYLEHAFGNASSATHIYGWDAAQAVDEARGTVADLLGVQQPADIVFTSGATEANNAVIHGITSMYATPPHIITTAIEHPSIIAPCEAARARGAAVVDFINPGRDGVVGVSAIERLITPDTRLISVMAVNNELGTIQPIEEIVTLARARGILMHVDATQAIGKIPFDIGALGIELVSFSAHKMYGPKGVGGLYLKSDTPAANLPPLIYGGGQERGIRSGTLAVPLIVGLGAAARLAIETITGDAARITLLRNTLWEALVSQVPHVTLNGNLERQLPGCLNFSVPGVPSDVLIAGAAEIAISAGSACSSGKAAQSHVLEAIGADYERQRGAVRIGVGRDNTLEDIQTAAQGLVRAIRAASVSAN
jgi:cysteine desulfurase